MSTIDNKVSCAECERLAVWGTRLFYAMVIYFVVAGICLGYIWYSVTQINEQYPEWREENPFSVENQPAKWVSVQLCQYFDRYATLQMLLLWETFQGTVDIFSDYVISCNHAMKNYADIKKKKRKHEAADRFHKLSMRFLGISDEEQGPISL